MIKTPGLVEAVERRVVDTAEDAKRLGQGGGCQPEDDRIDRYTRFTVMGEPNGSSFTNELIELLIHAFVLPGTHMVTSASTFVIYKLATQAMGRAYREAPLGPDRGYDMKALAEAVDQDTRLVFIANPANPTGAVYTEEEVRRVIDLVVRHDLFLIFGENNVVVLEQDVFDRIVIGFFSGLFRGRLFNRCFFR